jgi:hypothetical protein
VRGEGEIMVIVTPLEAVVVPVDVVVAVVVPWRMSNPLWYWLACPSGLVTRMSQKPVVVSGGMTNVQVIKLDEVRLTLVAAMDDSPDFTKATVAPVWKF